ncbi:MAG: peptidoglycan DD-metalloendopeptidase family protein [Gallionellaceae bacterium]|jgi:murein DD-endopeptidase MepM/ murein hydrolase activator NlpD
MHTLTAITPRICLLFSLMFSAFSPLAHASLPRSSNVPGGVVIITLVSTAASSNKPQAWLGDQAVLVKFERQQWHAVVGLPLDMKPGAYELKFKVGDETWMQPFEVVEKSYPEQHITIKDTSKVELSAKDEARAVGEISAIKVLKRHWREDEDTDVEFIIPAEGRLSGNFGLRRFFNGEPRSPHAGLDVAVARGTWIKASAGGKVLAVDDYFFNGKTIFVDHGNGLITMYCHLDRFKVKKGQTVRKGQLLGLSGKTGRATGPHLHWSVVLNGAMVDPALFIPAQSVR